jgi:hypothetical protein
LHPLAVEDIGLRSGPSRPTAAVVAPGFLNWFDQTPRAEMRGELLAEVSMALAARGALAGAAAA